MSYFSPQQFHQGDSARRRELPITAERGVWMGWNRYALPAAADSARLDRLGDFQNDGQAGGSNGVVPGCENADSRRLIPAAAFQFDVDLAARISGASSLARD